MKFSSGLKTLAKISLVFPAAVPSANSSSLVRKRPAIREPNRSFLHDITAEVKDGIAVTSSRVKDFLAQQNVDYKQGFTSLVVECKQCKNCTNAKADQGRIFINNTTGGFVCAQCLWSGHWQKFEQSLEKFRKMETDDLQKRKKDTETKPIALLDSIAQAKEELALTARVSSLTDEEFGNLTALHQVQGMEKKTFDKFGVRVYNNKQDLFFPRYHLDKKKICGYRKLSVRQMPEETVITELIFPRGPGSALGLFGWDLINADSTEVILVSTEFDAMIIHQALRKPVLCLPKGISVLPVESLPMFEQFKKITLWLNGGKNRAWQSAKLFARKLVETRCLLVSPEIAQTNPVTVFKEAGNLLAVTQRAQQVSHKSIITFSSFRQEVYNELHNVDEACGLRWTRFPLLNRILKGHRKGELTVFTGPTGAGKTTFLSEYSLDLCSQGLRTLWGSFEIKNSRLVKTMLNQYSKMSLHKHVKDFDEWADKFEQLALYFMVFYGQESMDNVLDAMKHAVYVHDIEHIVVDNLQFMMGSISFKTLHDRIVRQDQMIEGFRRFASTYDCHVTIVMHPRKELEALQLTAQSIYGGVKASQEADNILILQSNKGKSGVLQGKKYIEIVKNRFDGELGIMPLYFNKDSQSFMRNDRTARMEHEKSKTQEDDPAVSSIITSPSDEPQVRHVANIVRK